MDFKHEDPVEICKKGEGFSGIYYNATFLAAIGRNRYLVRYDTRFNEDGYRKLVEAVDSDEIRPLPPKTAYTKFVVSDRVEAYVNLAWRVGTVTRKVDPNYYVKLDCNGREEHCAFYKVRLHLEWRNGRWSYPGSGSQSSQANTSAQGGQPATGGNIADTGDQGGQPKNEGDQPKPGQGRG
ncbi:hypothetical protein SCA6_020051 [Theobroma cacao]|uniref:DUF724 domain-containing protein 2 n=1 Tax=Theobroma cacao TaxID=3641 RepID=A0AB32WI30_THECC|nr:PREDICTED: DUF724 domain-containing protein 2 [Theobroma cacao]